MALYDQRIFRHGDRWWCAEVHSGGTAVYFGDAPADAPLTHETIIFTPLTDPDSHSRCIQVPANKLHRWSHAVISKLLKTASNFGEHFKMSPFNHPRAESRWKGPILRYAKDQTEWSWRVSSMVALDPNRVATVAYGLELRCLDDSALFAKLFVGDESDARKAVDDLADEQLLEMVHMVVESEYDNNLPANDELP